MVGWGSEEVCNIFENRNSLAIVGNSTTVPQATSSTDGAIQMLHTKPRKTAGQNCKRRMFLKTEKPYKTKKNGGKIFLLAFL
jgi:hypothetical protein